jgi:hypothetical protein
VNSRLRQHCQQLELLYRERGLAQGLHHLARALLAAFYHREVQYILVKKVASQEAVSPVPGEESGTGTECVIVESAAVLQEVVREMPATLRDSVEQLKARVEQGCLVLLAYRPPRSGVNRDLIGYMLCERGIFSALGRKGKISSDILFTHYQEVLPEYRGQRIADVMRRAPEVYCRAQGLTKRCAVVSSTNEPSIRSTLRSGYMIAGTVTRVSILRGRFTWETPWEKIEKVLRGFAPMERPRPLGA